jgi:hypothetical protein
MIELLTTKDVIDALGGISGISELTGSNAKAIYMWRATAFPWKMYPIITGALRDRGMTAPVSLFGMKSKEGAA